MKQLIALVAALALPCLAFAADNPDESFFENAAEAGHAEVAAGNVAKTKGMSADVKKFAATMVTDHTAANEKLKAIADKKGVKLPTEPSLKQKTKQKLLELKDGAEFDSAYIDAQIEDHEATVKLLQEEITTGKDADAKAFATQTLPKVKHHLKMVQALKAGHAGHSTSTH